MKPEKENQISEKPTGQQLESENLAGKPESFKDSKNKESKKEIFSLIGKLKAELEAVSSQVEEISQKQTLEDVDSWRDQQRENLKQAEASVDKIYQIKSDSISESYEIGINFKNDYGRDVSEETLTRATNILNLQPDSFFQEYGNYIFSGNDKKNRNKKDRFREHWNILTRYYRNSSMKETQRTLSDYFNRNQTTISRSLKQLKPYFNRALVRDSLLDQIPGCKVEQEDYFGNHVGKITSGDGTIELLGTIEIYNEKNISSKEEEKGCDKTLLEEAVKTHRNSNSKNYRFPVHGFLKTESQETPVSFFLPSVCLESGCPKAPDKNSRANKAWMSENMTSVISDLKDDFKKIVDEATA